MNVLQKENKKVKILFDFLESFQNLINENSD